MSLTTLQATDHLNQQSRRLVLVVITFLIGGLIGVSLIGIVTAQQLKRQVGLKQQRLSLLQAAIANKRLADLAAGELSGIHTITEIFPNDQSIITVIQKLENLVKTFDPGGSVKFTSLAPVKTNNQLTIPLQFHLRLAPTQGLRFLTELENIPNIIVVKNVELKTPQGASGAADMTLGALMYVKDPFTQPN